MYYSEQWVQATQRRHDAATKESAQTFQRAERAHRARAQQSKAVGPPQARGEPGRTRWDDNTRGDDRMLCGTAEKRDEPQRDEASRPPSAAHVCCCFCCQQAFDATKQQHNQTFQTPPAHVSHSSSWPGAAGAVRSSTHPAHGGSSCRGCVPDSQLQAPLQKQHQGNTRTPPRAALQQPAGSRVRQHALTVTNSQPCRAECLNSWMLQSSLQHTRAPIHNRMHSPEHSSLSAAGGQRCRLTTAHVFRTRPEMRTRVQKVHRLLHKSAKPAKQWFQPLFALHRCCLSCLPLHHPIAPHVFLSSKEGRARPAHMCQC